MSSKLTNTVVLWVAFSTEHPECSVMEYLRSNPSVLAIKNVPVDGD
jgi:hypothetical protein